MKKLLSRATLIVTKFNQFLLFIGAVSIFIMIVVDVLNVIGAKAGVMIVPSGKTIIEEMLVVIIYIGMGYVMLNRGHIKTDILKNRFPHKVSFALDIFTFVLIIAVSTYIFVKNAGTFMLFFTKGISLPGIVQIPKWPAQLLLVLGFLNLAVCTMLLLLESLLLKFSRITSKTTLLLNESRVSKN